MRVVVPKPLRLGDSVAVFLPARAVDHKDIEFAFQLLKKQGFRISDLHAIGKHYYQYPLPDVARADLINKQLQDESISMLWTGRGGLGTLPILDRIQWFKLVEKPKWIMGYSDITAVLLHLWTNYRLITIHGPVMRDLKEELNLLELTRKPPSFEWQAQFILNPGTVSGYFIGGNLSIIYSLVGSNSLPQNWHDVILFIEEVDEYIYHIERMLVSLDRAGILPSIKALVLGSFTDIHDHETPLGKTVFQIIREVAGKYGYPIVSDFPAGHGAVNKPFWHGAYCNFSVGNNNAQIVMFCHINKMT